MTQEHRAYPRELTSFGHPAARFFVFALLLAFGAGCSEQFQECVAEWQECKEDCPTLEEEQQILADAAAAEQDCLSNCPPLPQGGPCIKRCIEAFAAATAQVGCNQECDDAFADCVEAIAPAPALSPAPLARQVGPASYEVDRVVLAGLLSSPLGALQGATVAPISIDAGIGFVLVAAEPGAVLSQLGVEPGDVLTLIAGRPVSAASLQLAMHNLLTSGEARATLLRAGAQRNLTYSLH
jgi:hypothetical protein